MVLQHSTGLVEQLSLSDRVGVSIETWRPQKEVDVRLNFNST